MNQNDKRIVWWRSKRNQKIVRYVGTSCMPTKHNKVAVIEYLDEHDQYELGYVNLHDYEPLPDCTGFDWVPLSKCVPFEFNEVPLDAWYKSNVSSSKFRITGTCEEHGTFKIDGQWLTTRHILDNYTIDGKPAGRVRE